jgi:hypothetical protein
MKKNKSGIDAEIVRVPLKYRLGKMAACLLFMVGIVFSSTASAAVLLSMDFSDGYKAGQSLIGQSGSGDVGLLGFGGPFLTGNDPYGATKEVCSLIVTPISEANLTYQVKGGGTIKSGTNVIALSVSGGSVHNLLYRPLKTPLTGVTFYARIVIFPLTPIQCTATDLVFALTNLDGQALIGASSSPGLGLYNSKAGAAINGGSNPPASSQALNPNVPNLLIARYDWDGSRYSKVSIWLNPTASSEATPDASVQDSTGATTMSHFGLGCANMDNDSKSYFGSWMIATKWNDVVPPASDKSSSK